MSDKRRHPSGRPIRRDYEKKLSIPRPVFREPLTLGLRREENTRAIGFLHDFASDESDD